MLDEQMREFARDAGISDEQMQQAVGHRNSQPPTSGDIDEITPSEGEE